MTSPLSASATLEREYLAMRAKVLELAASFDRIARSEGGVSDARLARLKAGVRILLEEEEGRAERVQLHFSNEYSKAWRESFGLAKN